MSEPNPSNSKPTATSGSESEAPYHKMETKSFGRAKLNIDWAPHTVLIANRFIDNYSRICSLISLYKYFREEKASSRRGRTPAHQSDILRAAVVLMHAALEDALRSVMRERLPRTKDTLDTISLVGLNDHGRAEKFHLGELVRFKGKTVESIIEDSIGAYLGKQSFNNRSDVCRVLTLLDMDAECYARILKRIGEMISRRHKIVHYADLDSSQGRGHHLTQSINVADVIQWNEAVKNLLRAICCKNALIEDAGGNEKLPKKLKNPARGSSRRKS